VAEKRERPFAKIEPTEGKWRAPNTFQDDVTPGTSWSLKISTWIFFCVIIEDSSDDSFHLL
jgi:hypothetical protein